MSPSNPNIELLKKLAEASGWTIPDERIAEMAANYDAVAKDTRAVREADIRSAVPATVFEAE
jgi:hypothetical protein